MAPPTLARRLPCLPPMLHRCVRISVPSYSQGSRGLSVLPRVNGIFTASSISLSPWLRQWGSRYAIRAGRNLPAKEFRYLRTVIVTAAVYWGFDSQLRPKGLTAPLNLPAPGRRQTLYVLSREFAESCVFGKQSLPPCSLQPRLAGPARGLTDWRHTFSRSYGVNLPSSLTRVLSSALVYSTHLPVLVYGTGPKWTRTRDFSRKYGFNPLTWLPPGEPLLPLSPSRSNVYGLWPPIRTGYGVEPGYPSPGGPSALRPPSSSSSHFGVREY